MNIYPRSGEQLLLVWFSCLVGRVLSSTFDLTHDFNFNLGWLNLEFGSCHEKSWAGRDLINFRRQFIFTSLKLYISLFLKPGKLNKCLIK